MLGCSATCILQVLPLPLPFPFLLHSSLLIESISTNCHRLTSGCFYLLGVCCLNRVECTSAAPFIYSQLLSRHRANCGQFNSLVVLSVSCASNWLQSPRCPAQATHWPALRLLSTLSPASQSAPRDTKLSLVPSRRGQPLAR